MVKYFKLSNVILIVLFFAIVYFGYLSFLKKGSEKNNILNSYSTNKNFKQTESNNLKSKDDSGDNKDYEECSDKSFSDKSEGEFVTPVPKVLQNEIINETETVEKEESEKPENGFYENATYNYQVVFPRDWPLRIRSKENISLGYVIPEEGLGAVTIEVSDEENSEIEELEQETKKYPGMVKMEEKSVFIDGVKGTKYILTENLSGDESVFILVKKNNYDYLIKYPSKLEDLDSKKFLIEVNSILSNFKFND